ncbi:TPA: tRNA (guanosine(37)-N1)-methyltransferase TrmD [Patescibacteria group bacterium]|nr:tRNA (guanosine(37)-N1)-methyltransferase TrmD [Patescibacteria group bacterium]
MKRFDIITIFPHSLDSYFDTSILKRAQEKKLIQIQTHDLRQWTKDKHQTVDDKPYGGGAGMVMKAEPIVRALHELKFKNKKSKIKMRMILLAANGKQFTQTVAKRLAKYERLVFICGRYEGVDARVEKFVDEKICIGPYVVTGGELPTAIIIDAVSRMVPGVVGKEESILNESFSKQKIPDSRFPIPDSYLEHPHYTRPEVLIWKGKKYTVPKVLLEGNHKKISEWKKDKSKYKSIKIKID